MKQDKNEIRWDKLLKIRTTGRDDSKADQYRYPYEPTPYSVLERLANSGLIRKNNTLIDYGCGKGRVDYFMAYQTKANQLELSTMSVFMKRQRQIKKLQCHLIKS